MLHLVFKQVEILGITRLHYIMIPNPSKSFFSWMLPMDCVWIHLAWGKWQEEEVLHQGEPSGQPVTDHWYFPGQVQSGTICVCAVPSLVLVKCPGSPRAEAQPEQHPGQETEMPFSQFFSFPLHLKYLSVAWILIINLLILIGQI